MDRDWFNFIKLVCISLIYLIWIRFICSWLRELGGYGEFELCYGVGCGEFELLIGGCGGSLWVVDGEGVVVSGDEIGVVEELILWRGGDDCVVIGGYGDGVSRCSEWGGGGEGVWVWGCGVWCIVWYGWGVVW